MNPRSPFAFSIALACTACGGDDASGPNGSAGSSGAGAGGAGGETAAPEAYTLDLFESARISSDASAENFQKVTTTFDLRDAPFSSATLVVDLETTCFPFESWQSNPPPPGHTYPADCDAFDRNFEVFLDGGGAEPALELVRAITPFGGPLHLEVDITDVANGLPGEHGITTFISTWSDASGQVTGAAGGWNVSARLEVTPGTAPREVLAVQPLFYETQTDPDVGAVELTTPAGTTGARIDYRATGHGGVTFSPGCGPSGAEEFCRRTFAIFFDEVLFTDLDPWRDDCAELCTIAHYGPPGGGFDYCIENPTGAIASVRAPRANWCPGDVSPPFELVPPDLLTPGGHTFRWRISDVADGGSWRISATYFALGSGGGGG